MGCAFIHTGGLKSFIIIWRTGFGRLLSLKWSRPFRGFGYSSVGAGIIRIISRDRYRYTPWPLCPPARQDWNIHLSWSISPMKHKMLQMGFRRCGLKIRLIKRAAVWPLQFPLAYTCTFSIAVSTQSVRNDSILPNSLTNTKAIFRPLWAPLAMTTQLSSRRLKYVFP